MNFYFACPSCGSNELFTKPKEQSSDLGCALFFLGGFLPALLYANHKHSRIQCGRCGYVFQQPIISNTPVAVFARWMLGLTLVLLIAWALLLAISNSQVVLPAVPVLSQVEEAVSVNPRVAAYLLTALLTLNLLVSSVVALVSNTRSRNRLAKVYRLHPLNPRELAETRYSEIRIPVSDPGQTNVEGEPSREPNRDGEPQR